MKAGYTIGNQIHGMSSAIDVYNFHILNHVGLYTQTAGYYTNMPYLVAIFKIKWKS